MVEVVVTGTVDVVEGATKQQVLLIGAEVVVVVGWVVEVVEVDVVVVGWVVEVVEVDVVEVEVVEVEVVVGVLWETTVKQT